VAGAANREEVLAHFVKFAAFQFFAVLAEPEYPAAHKDMGMLIMVGLDLIEAFIHPVNTISAIDHGFRMVVVDSARGVAYLKPAGSSGFIPTSSANSVSICSVAKSASFLA